MIHFCAIGGLVFVLHRAVAGPGETAAEPEKTRTIVVDERRVQELTALFEQRQGRPPTAEERTRLMERWVEDEALFRHGLALGLARHDPALREQLIARVRSMLQASLQLPEPSEAMLRRHYEGHRARYTRPETRSFVRYWVPRGPSANDRARSLRAALLRGDRVQAVPTHHVEQSQDQLTGQLGAPVARALFALELDVWSVLRSPGGLHVVRVERSTPERAPRFEELRPEVALDLRRQQTQKRFDRALSSVVSRFDVRRGAELP